MDYVANGATEYGVGAIFCRMTHTVMSAISSKNHIFALESLQKGSLITLPVFHNRWYQQVTLMVEICGEVVNYYTHVFEHKQDHVY